jgi:hypothetical protein
MKILIPILIGLLVVGCGKEEKSEKQKPEELLIDPILATAVKNWDQAMPEARSLTKVELQRIKFLTLGGRQLTQLPKGLELLTGLTELNLYGCKLTNVKGLEKLTRLESLEIGGNELADVSGLENLTQLKFLDLCDHQLTELPKGLENLTQLEVLHLVDCKLTNVKGLEKLTKLEELNLVKNPDLTKAQIDELQKALPKCKIIHQYEPVAERENLKPSKELTPEEKKALSDKVVGTYQMKLPNGLFTMTVQKDGTSLLVKLTNSGEEESETGKWKIEDGNLVTIGEEETGIIKINPDGSLTMIATIENGVRKNLDPKISSLRSMKKIK